MAEIKFPKLTKDDIEVRVGSVAKGSKGVTLLLYKNARVDMRLLDETVGSLNWQKSYNRDNANCVISIWDEKKNQWISKEDTGVESNNEAEKGLASDSFKRAGFNWGIGRELYTSPFIYFKAGEEANVSDGKCYDRFKVVNISINDDRRITSVEVLNETTKCSKVFKNKQYTEETPATTPKKEKASATRASKKSKKDEKSDLDTLGAYVITYPMKEGAMSLSEFDNRFGTKMFLTFLKSKAPSEEKEALKEADRPHIIAYLNAKGIEVK